jgi:hypothetical protein
MVECECLPACPFFNEKMADMPVTANRMKKRFCLTDNSECARHMVFAALGRDSVPIDLFPHNAERARQIMAVRQTA